MIKAYIAHPFRGTKPYTAEKCRENMELVSNLCRSIADRDDVIPISPLHTFCYLDAIKFDQSKALKLCFSLMDGCDEVWMFGDYSNSIGCKAEIAHAAEKNIPVRYFEDSDFLK